jgi:acetyl esterase/lipase
MDVGRYAPGTTPHAAQLLDIPRESSFAWPSIGRRAVAFRPECADGLEDRVMLSGGVGKSEIATRAADNSSDLSNVVYTTLDGYTERLDVTLPPGTPPPGGWPVLLAIHGGGWRKFDKEEYGPRVARAFVPEGYAVVAPNYVLSTPTRSTWPINFEDIQAAIRWIRDESGALGVNPNQIAAIGESAGADLSALAGTDPSPDVPGTVSDRVNAVVAFSTPTNLTKLYYESSLARTPVVQYLGGPPKKVLGNYVAASPIDHVSASDPPMLLVQGLQDPLIPVSQARQMAAALTAAGVTNRLILVNGGHALAFPDHYAYLVPRVLEFLTETWKNSQTPS